MTSKNFKKIFLRLGLIVILMFLLLPTVSVIAGDSTYTYTVLAPLPGTTEGTCTYDSKGVASAGCQTTLQKYLPGAFSLAIGLSAVFAVVMIVLGGFQYMSSDAIQGKEDGRNRIKNSVYGLVLVIAAYLILYTVNPNLLTLNLTIDAVEINAQYGTGGQLAPIVDSLDIVARVRQNCPSCEVNVSTTYRLSEADQARLNCPTCAPMTGIPIANNATTNVNGTPALAASLAGLKNGLGTQGVEWGVTEAYPPTIHHQSDCHFNGTCVDVALRGADAITPTNIGSATTAENLKRFIETASNNGLRAEFEVKTNAERDTLLTGLRNLGMTEAQLTRAVITVPQITGPHFSVYR